MPRRAGGIVAVAAVLVSIGPGSVTGRASARPGASLAALGAFTLPQRGIELWMHPTSAPIGVSSAGGALLKACEVGTSFSRYWRGGCRRLVGGRLTLPGSGGAMHVGFRIVPVAGRAVRIRGLRVRWHCVDHFFVLERRASSARVVAPVVFDC